MTVTKTYSIFYSLCVSSEKTAKGRENKKNFNCGCMKSKAQNFFAPNIL